MSKEILEQAKELASQYDNLNVESVDYDNGKLVLGLNVQGAPNMGLPNDLPPGTEITSAGDVTNEHGVSPIFNKYATGGMSYANTPTHLMLDPMSRQDLDLAKKSVLDAEPQELYKRSIEYSKSKDIYGTVINVLTNFSSKGFENDVDDPTIKDFYDNWCVDVGFDDIVEKIFYDFFRVGLVRTYRIMGRYEPKINQLSTIPGKEARKANAETGARKQNRYTKSHIPIAYTVLNPCLVKIKGSLLFGQTATCLDSKAGEELKPLLEAKKSTLSTFQRKIIDSLPADFKKAVLENDDIPLEPDLIGEVDYRRMPYERYPTPRGARAFEAIEFKDELRKADYSTLDGITNYILKITVGSDKHPVTKNETLETVSRLFDTVSKSYKVVWNHTLDVEKITSEEIGDILGKDKYLQVNDDITGSLGIVRALVDGTGDLSGAAADLAVKSIIEEINYARRQVKRWIYSEYRTVAEAMGFKRFPKVRFDDMALRDELAMMSIIQGMIDRRIISYRTGQKKLGFDPDTELAQLREEKEHVLDGDLGLIGSPFQQSGGGNVQDEQRTSKGTPSEGRPRGRPAKKPEDKDKTKPPKGKKKDQVVDNEKAFLKDRARKQIGSRIESLSLEELETLLEDVKRAKKSRDQAPEDPEEEQNQEGASGNTDNAQDGDQEEEETKNKED